MIGDVPDITNRLQRWLPASWFPGGSGTLIAAILTGMATALAAITQLIQGVTRQTRIATATDGFLDLIAADFFGLSLQRRAGEGDAPYSQRIRREILRPRATRAALDQVITDLTGAHPQIFEPRRPLDTGGYDAGGVGYDLGGGYSGQELPYQLFVTVPVPLGNGIPDIGGWDQGALAYDVASASEWTDPDQIMGSAPNASEIYAAIENVRPAGVIIWVKFAV